MTRTAELLKRSLAAVAAIAVGAALIVALMTDPGAQTGLAGAAAEALDESGVSNPVTAVLLNFRAFDTLLEIAVLLLTLIGVWALRLRLSSNEALPPSIVFDGLLYFSAPLLTIVAGYLLWIGASAPGGAFQAGGVLAGAGVLMRLAGLPILSIRYLRWLAALGLFTFVVVALALTVTSAAPFEYPPPLAGTLILVIETAATVSIAATLIALYVAAEPPQTTSVS